MDEVVRKTYELNGGVGELGPAVDEIQAMIAAEKKRKADLLNVKAKTEAFAMETMRVDAAVAAKSNSRTEEFFRTNPWMRPVPEHPAEIDWDEVSGGTEKAVRKCLEMIKKRMGNELLIKLARLPGGMAVLGTGAMTATAGAFALPAFALRNGLGQKKDGERPLYIVSDQTPAPRPTPTPKPTLSPLQPLPTPKPAMAEVAWVIENSIRQREIEATLSWDLYSVDGFSVYGIETDQGMEYFYDGEIGTGGRGDTDQQRINYIAYDAIRYGVPVCLGKGFWIVGGLGNGWSGSGISGKCRDGIFGWQD